MSDLIVSDRFKRIQEIATKELEDRIRDTPEEFENNELIRLVIEMGKLELAVQKKRDEEMPALVKIWDKLKGLPKQRQIELLVEAAQQVDDEVPNIRLALVELVGEHQAEKLLRTEAD